MTIFALGGLLLPALLKDGYSDRFSMGLITSSGSLGLLFPPSLPLILYGVIAESRIDHLFLAGILPGTLMLILLAGYSMTREGSRTVRKKRYTSREIFDGLREIAWELPLPVILLGGIYGGADGMTSLTRADNGDYVLIHAAPGSMIIEAQSKDVVPDTYTCKLSADRCEQIESEAETIYSLDYLSDIAADMKATDEVIFRFAANLPCEIGYARDGVEIAFILAPRIESE